MQEAQGRVDVAPGAHQVTSPRCPGAVSAPASGHSLATSLWGPELRVPSCLRALVGLPSGWQDGLSAGASSSAPGTPVLVSEDGAWEGPGPSLVAVTGGQALASLLALWPAHSLPRVSGGS